MNWNQLILNGDIVYLFFKAFSLIFSFMYFIYALVIYRQTQIMNKALDTERKNIFSSISFLQLTVALIIILLALLLV
ncbi:hypothetical protein GYA28_02545 [Candidatus Roizmanbacteria bacterium]|jgi:hypothetical protein|nr:hypothetical protein [Candidatus Roizmanbacteria bacterium]